MKPNGSKYIISYAAMIAAAFLATACGGEDSVGSAIPTAAVAPPITITGTLGSSLAEFTARPLSCDVDEWKETTAEPRLFGLAGTIVQCNTLTNPPATGSATTDANGNFSVTFNGSGVPFSCFLSTASGGTVVPLSFSNSTGTGSSSIVTSSGGSVPLGTIAVSVDSSTGAQTVTGTLSSSTTVSLNTSTPPGLPCLVGLWSGQTAATCGNIPNGLPPKSKLSLNVSQLPNGTYVGALTYTGMISQAVNGLVLQTGPVPALTTCIPPYSSGNNPITQTNLVVGMSALDQSGGNYFPAGTTIAALPGANDPTCPLGIVLSQPSVNTSQVSITMEFANCNATAPALNLTSISYDPNASTMTIVHPAKCSLTGVAPFQNNGFTQCSSGSNAYVGTLTSGSKCLTITSGGSGSLPTGLVSGDTVASNAMGSLHPTTTIYKSSDAANFCAAGQVQLLNPATATANGATIRVSAQSIGTGYFIGNYTAGSRCVTPTALPPGVGANNDIVSDSSTLTNNKYFTTVTATCSSFPGALQLTSAVTIQGGGTLDVLMTDTSVNNGPNNSSQPFWATLTSGSPCVLPRYVGDNNRIELGGIILSTTNGDLTADTATNYGACSSGQAQLGLPATTSSVTTFTDNTNAGGSFTGVTTTGSTCVTPTLGNLGDIVADHNGALPSGTTIAYNDNTICTTSQIELSNPAGSAAGVGENIAIVPMAAVASTGCYFGGTGPALDASGNAYWNGAGNNCNSNSLTTAQQQTAYTETEVIPINSSCTSLWDTASVACIANPNSANCSGTPAPAFTSGTYVKSVSGCAACFPTAGSGTADAGCVGVGNVTCTSHIGATANQVLSKQ